MSNLLSTDVFGEAAPHLGPESIIRGLEQRRYDRVFHLSLLPNGAPLERLQHRLDAIDDEATLRRWFETLTAALRDQSDATTTRKLIAWLLDGFPRRRLAADAFLQAAVALLAAEGASAAILASASLQIIAERRSAPAVADILAEAKAARQRTIEAKELVARALLARGQAEKLLGTPARLECGQSRGGQAYSTTGGER